MHASDPTAASLTASPSQTIDALETGAVVRWWQTSAFLEVAGPDAASFLDGLCTQAVERIERGTGVVGLFLDSKAHIVAPAVLHRMADAAWTNPRTNESDDSAPRILVETLPELVEPLRAHLARYRLRAKATLEPVELCTVALVGDGLPTDLPEARSTWSAVDGQARRTHAFIGSAEACADVVRSASTDRGIALADPDAFEADRIERGIASLHDLLPGRMPAEVGGMDTAVALDAGCYLGQEPVARLHYRGKANRTLRRLEAAGDLHPAASADASSGLALVRADAEAGTRPVGQLTTWATAPDGRVLALAMLRRELGTDEQLRLDGDPDSSLHALDGAPE
jgi:folate-binding protein YgfZ